MDMTFGQRLRELRIAAGLSQEQLAEKLDLSRQAVSKWENGDSTPDLERLTLLGDLFQVSLDHLVRGPRAGEEQPTPFPFEKLMEKNRLLRRRQTLMIVGGTACALAAVSAAVLCAVQGTAVKLTYLLYRFLTVGEFTYVPADFRVSLLLTAAVFAAGCGCLLCACRLRK